MRCRSGDRCAGEALAGERFCGPHLAQLHRVRDELFQEARDRAPQSEKRCAATVRGEKRKQREAVAGA